jgi:hypothetical protein
MQGHIQRAIIFTRQFALLKAVGPWSQWARPEELTLVSSSSSSSRFIGAFFSLPQTFHSCRASNRGDQLLRFLSARRQVGLEINGYFITLSAMPISMRAFLTAVCFMPRSLETAIIGAWTFALGLYLQLGNLSIRKSNMLWVNAKF